MAVARLSVRLSRVDPKSRTEGRNELKFGRKEAHDMGDPWPDLVVKRSNICRVGKFWRRTAYVLYTDVNV